MHSAKVAIVTGGAQGIGKAISLHLARERYAVIVADTDEEAGEELEGPYKKIYNITFKQTDIADEHSVEAVFDFVKQAYGRLDLLVNNAADAGADNPDITKLSLGEWNKKIGTNLSGAFLCSKCGADLLKASNGAIVNIASTRALMSEPNNEAYAASKGGIVSLTHALANSLGPEVRVNAVSPGWIEVRDWQKRSVRQDPQLREMDHKQHPVGRVGRPEDVAQLVAFLGSEKAGFVTGQNIVIDGGMTKKMIYAE